MPLPVIIALPFLIEAMLAALAYLLRRALVAVAVDLVWSYVKPRLLDWAERAVPGLLIRWLNFELGTSLTLPLTPESLTAEINAKLGENIFADITDREQVKRDCAALALARLNAALPGLQLVQKDFAGTMTAKRALRHKVRLCVQRQAISALEVGGSELFPSDVIAPVMAALVDGYDWQPHVNKEGIKNEVGREMARWYARHLTRTWQPK